MEVGSTCPQAFPQHPICIRARLETGARWGEGLPISRFLFDGANQSRGSNRPISTESFRGPVNSRNGNFQFRKQIREKILPPRVAGEGCRQQDCGSRVKGAACKNLAVFGKVSGWRKESRTKEIRGVDRRGTRKKGFFLRQEKEGAEGIRGNYKFWKFQPRPEVPL